MRLTLTETDPTAQCLRQAVDLHRVYRITRIDDKSDVYNSSMKAMPFVWRYPKVSCYPVPLSPTPNYGVSLRLGRRGV